jgi:hypothetical protein
VVPRPSVRHRRVGVPHGIGRLGHPGGDRPLGARPTQRLDRRPAPWSRSTDGRLLRHPHRRTVGRQLRRVRLGRHRRAVRLRLEAGPGRPRRTRRLGGGDRRGLLAADEAIAPSVVEGGAPNELCGVRPRQPPRHVCRHRRHEPRGAGIDPGQLRFEAAGVAAHQLGDDRLDLGPRRGSRAGERRL